jgi:hypothetical protein
MLFILSERFQDNLVREGEYISIYRLDDVIYLVPTLAFFQELEENPEFFDKPADYLWYDLLEDALCDEWLSPRVEGMGDYFFLTDDYYCDYDGELSIIYDRLWFIDLANHFPYSLVEILKTKGYIDLYRFE